MTTCPSSTYDCKHEGSWFQAHVAKSAAANCVCFRAWPPAPSCPKAIHTYCTLQGEETYDTVPNSRLVVSRTAHRNNTSNYYLNGKKSNFTEVTTTLKDKGVDLNNNRFLILQVTLSLLSLQC